MSQAMNWRVGPHRISLTICPEGSYLSFPTPEPSSAKLISLTCYIHISHTRALHRAMLYAHQLKTHQFVFYVNTPRAEELDSFPIQIFEGLTKWLNHQASCWSGAPSGWLIEAALTPFVQPPAASANLQVGFNEMSPMWHRRRPFKRTRRQGTSWPEWSFTITVPVRTLDYKELEVIDTEVLH